MIAVLERADGIQPGCRVVLGKEKEKEILAAIGSHSAASVGREGKWLQAEVCHTIINMVPLDRKLASLNQRAASRPQHALLGWYISPFPEAKASSSSYVLEHVAA